MIKLTILEEVNKNFTNKNPFEESIDNNLEECKISLKDYLWLVKRAEKYEELEQSWNQGIEEKQDTIIFLRKCKEVIEDFKIETRGRPMS